MQREKDTLELIVYGVLSDLNYDTAVIAIPAFALVPSLSPLMCHLQHQRLPEPSATDPFDQALSASQNVFLLCYG